ncbi:hypothetical protein J2X31_000525 [Flavobacterium arsenatis]|uniref:Uncharacterized protein n=1 Tax=Flavobacterium arsenatis TaxID=1484332 RepID=A0ABU1TM83_9FLAO|nr:hypothetical protein [Flavobacterium arsenatis]MDR6966532.1 hypothetical protein [Flavobacterium arsenatis]
MKDKDALILFATISDPEIITDYRNKLYENLQDINSKEEKYSLWLLIIILFYLGNSSIPSFTIGPATIDNSPMFSKILPMIFTAIVFNLNLLVRHKIELNSSLETISSISFNQFLRLTSKKSIKENYVYKMYLPYSISSGFPKLFRKRASISEIVFVLTLLIPIIIMAFIPYVLVSYMLYDLFQNHFTDVIGKTSFFITAWLFIVMLYFIMVNTIDSICGEKTNTTEN